MEQIIGQIKGTPSLGSCNLRPSYAGMGCRYSFPPGADRWSNLILYHFTTAFLRCCIKE